jgi:hypothetical protein
VLLIKEGEKHDWESCEENVVNLKDPLLIKYLSRECAEESKPELRHNKENIFVECI